jgi:ribosomal protein L31E
MNTSEQTSIATEASAPQAEVKTAATAAAKPAAQPKAASKPAVKAVKKVAAKKVSTKAVKKVTTQVTAKASHKASPKVTIKAKPKVAEDKNKTVKIKMVRDSFTMPKDDFALIELIKTRAIHFHRPAKKSELLRAGLHALNHMSDATLKAALNALHPVKTGRPKSQEPTHAGKKK